MSTPNRALINRSWSATLLFRTSSVWNRDVFLAQAPCLLLSSFCVFLELVPHTLRRFCWCVGGDCSVCISTGGCGCCRCRFCCRSVACRRCCCSVVCRCCCSFGGVGLDLSVADGCCPIRSCCRPCVLLSHFPLHRRCHPNTISVALCELHKLLPSTPMTLASPIQWPCD